MSDLIGGIDFSGTPKRALTWAAVGRVRAGHLVIDRLEAIGRDGVVPLIRASDAGTWGLDFPFGLPAEFLAFLAARHGAPIAAWREYAAWLPAIGYLGFVAARDAYCSAQPEPRRETDRLFPSALSCLHKANPNLLRMTYEGIRLLADLSADSAVSPFTETGDRRIVEVYPGGTLRGLRLLVRGYKRGRNWAVARGSIVRGLTDQSPLPVTLTESQRRDCLNDDNALDAVAASLAVALLRERPAWFRPPPAAPGGWQREGWIWAPLPLP